jgi:hypothetical protein
MSRNLGPESAKIIPFPLKSRVFGSKPPLARQGAAAPKPPIQWGGSCYHQNAIDEAARDRKS